MDEEQDAAVTAAREEAMEALAQPDAILEASVFDAIQKFIKSQGNPGKLVVQLADSYHGFPQMAELLRVWLETSGMPEEEINELIKSHAIAWIKQRFDARVVDDMITKRRQVSRSLSWLKSLMDGLSDNADWRALIFSLSESVDTETFFLDLAVKTMVEKGHFEEATKHKSIARQQEIFALVLARCVSAAIKATTASDRVHFTELVCTVGCISKVVYMFTQALLHRLQQELTSSPPAAVVVRNIADALEEHVTKQGHSVRDVSFLLNATTTGHEVTRIARMMHTQQMTMADVDTLHRLYTSDDTPPVSYLQNRGMLEMLTREVFVGSTNNEKHTLQCRYLLAFATCVLPDQEITQETHDKISQTLETLESVFSLLQPITKHSWINLSKHIHLPVVARGLVLFIERQLCDSSCFLNFVPSSPPLCLMLLEQITTRHPGLRPQVLAVLTRALEYKYAIDAITLSRVQRLLMSRLLHLASLGFAIPVLTYIAQKQADLDTSLVVFFVIEIVDHMQSPFSPEFVHHFVAIVGQERTVVGIKTKGDRVNACRSFFSSLLHTRGVSAQDKETLRTIIAKL
ncbi:hypothetical protein PTSG_06463 [Salpingoeca rosetta]|uniref:Negative elongation factor C/D n=1 Tax=Salpingoeca rosetta (strain ATCC 50818 / BSB-021) TaxID=946362 RepID=F2UFV8_SALR5|nr:uncharacterized protein PTSG_06463 [Salpingoeca rosetta]EGD75386.1 hypothetical protein PTSG_06463 [Salpingoeca rosetta]|eukprot:XP_004991843.1 hypothetical protein PTSG_06463 [Salpingoeca rosetta]